MNEYVTVVHHCKLLIYTTRMCLIFALLSCTSALNEVNHSEITTPLHSINNSAVHLEIKPQNTKIRLGQKIQFASILYSPSDTPLKGIDVQWKAYNSRGKEITISTSGEFHAQSTGDFKITADTPNYHAETKVQIINSSLPNVQPKAIQIINDNLNKLQAFNHNQTLATTNEASNPHWNENNIASAADPKQRIGSNPLTGPDNLQKNDSAISNNYQLLIPVVNLPGRGLDLNLNFYYNSRLWHETDDSIIFNIDQEIIPGWTFGFPKLGSVISGTDKTKAQSMLIDASGTRHSYKGDFADHPDPDGTIRFFGRTSDGTLITYWHLTDKDNYLLTGQAKYPNGTIIDFNQPDYFGHLLPTRITDANGNYITITYTPLNFDQPPVIDTIVDTLGRVIQFHYERRPNRFPLITAITGPGLNGNTRNLIRFHYKQLTLDYLFPRNKTVKIHQSKIIDVVDAVYYPGTNTGYWFGESNSYSSYGMLKRVSERRGMTFNNAPLSEQGIISPGKMTHEKIYDYPLHPENNIGIPGYTTLAEIWEGMDSHVALTRFHFPIPTEFGPRIFETTLPDGTRIVRYSRNKPGQYDNGLVFEEDRYDSGGKLLQKSTAEWGKIQYSTPLLIKRQDIDERNQTTTIEYEYGQFDQITVKREYGYDGKLLRRTVFDHENSDDYLRRFILNLPSQVAIYQGDDSVPVSLTEFKYDQTSLKNDPGVTHHNDAYNPFSDPNVYDPATVFRGNLTQVTRFDNASNRSGAITSSYRYDLTGNLISSSKSPGEETSINYSAQTQYAYPEIVNSGAISSNSTARISVSTSYDFHTGLPLSVTDANGQTLETKYDPVSLRIDRLRRLTPNGADQEISLAYDDDNLTATQSVVSHGKLAAQTITQRNGIGLTRRLEVLNSANCIEVSEPSDQHGWKDNFLCSDTDYGLLWSYAGPISGKVCLQINEPSDPDAWSDNYLCSENNLDLEWSYAGPKSGKNCVQIYEPTDPEAWSDNYLCSNKDYHFQWTYSGLQSLKKGPKWNVVSSKYDVLGRLWKQSRPFQDGIEWSDNGPVAGKTCIQINEPSDQRGWNDNYLCTEQNLDLEWSFAGPIASKLCIQINEPSDPDAWSDNYLCSKKDYGIVWSYAGPINGKNCVKINELNDPHDWTNNYLCIDKEQGHAVQWSEIRYDALGRTIQQILPDSSTTLYVYNEALSPAPGQTIRTIDSWGREHWTRTDALGRLVEAKLGNTSASYEYNVLDQLIKITQGQQERKFRYDSLGRLTHQYLSEKDRTLNAAGTYVGSANDGEWSDVFTYDARSNLTSHTDARGIKAIYDYANDPLDRIFRITYDMSGFGDTANPALSASEVTIDYMTTGDVTRPRQQTIQNITTEEYTYNPKGLLSSKSLKLNALPSFPFETEYTFNEFDQLTDIRYPAIYSEEDAPGKLLHHDIGVGGQLTSLEIDGTPHASNIVYDAEGKITKLRVGGGSAHSIEESYVFDNFAGLLNQQKVQRANQSLLDLSYDYSLQNCTPPCTGRTGQLTRIVNNLNGKSYSYHYDAVGRLIEATKKDPNPPVSPPQPYLPPYWKQSYNYDDFGNRKAVSATRFAGGTYTCPPAPQTCQPPEEPAPTELSDGISNLSYDEKTNRITNPGFAYDAAGNLVQAVQASGISIRYQYDAAGRLAKVFDESGAELVGYTYGADRKRLISEYSKPINYRTYYVWDGDAVIADYRSLAQSSAQPIAWHQYVFLGDRLLATLRPMKKQAQVTTTESGSIGDAETNQDDFRIGGREERPKQNFHGVIDGVWVFNDALSSEEIEGFVKPQAKLVANWQFEDASGKKVTDKSGNSNDGELRRGAKFCIEGVSGTGAVCLDGENDYVQVGNNPSLKMKEALTISAWIYPKGPGNGRNGQGGIIVNKEGEYQVARFADGSIRCAFASDTSPSRWPWMNTGIIASEGRWTHITIVYDRGKITAYEEDKRETQVLYWHPDGLGTRLITNRSDTDVIEQATFPFGVENGSETSPEAKHIRRRFTSYDRDLNGSKLDYAVNRLYDHEQGRFTQVDPLEMGVASLTDPQSLNLYAYVQNDPVNVTDHLGLGDQVCPFEQAGVKNPCAGDTSYPSNGGPIIEVTGRVVGIAQDAGQSTPSAGAGYSPANFNLRGGGGARGERSGTVTLQEAIHRSLGGKGPIEPGRPATQLDAAAGFMAGVPVAVAGAAYAAGAGLLTTASTAMYLQSPRLFNSALAAGSAIVGGRAKTENIVATGFRGNKGFELANAPYQIVRNVATTIGGRQYTGHVLDQMQNRGFMPSVVENTIRTGTSFATRIGTSGYFDAVNSVRVITDTATGRVITVIPGGP